MTIAPPFLPYSTFSSAPIGRCVSGLLGLALLSSGLGSGSVAQVTRINVTAASHSSTYSVRVQASSRWGAQDATVSYESDSSATQTEIRDGLLAAMQADAVFSSVCSAVAGSNIITLTGTQGGADYTFTVTFPDNPSTDLTQTAITAAADAPTWTIGRFVELTGNSGQQPTVSAPTALTPWDITYTVTHGAGATYTGTLTVQDPDGAEIDIAWSASAGADLAATLAAIDAAIDAALLAAGIVGYSVDTSSPDVVASLPLGWGDIVSLTATATGGGGSPAMTVAVTEGDAIPEYGFVYDPQDRTVSVFSSSLTTLPPVNGQGQPCPIVEGGGQGWQAEVASNGSCTYGARVYVETASGATNGRATPTPSTTAAPVAIRRRPVVWGGADPKVSTACAVIIG